MRYPCPECDYAATTPGALKIHVESKHEGVRYPCSKCEYTATSTSSRNSHFKNKH